MGQKLIYVPECHSTNSSLSEFTNQAELPEGTLLITDHQTKGRGQRGNTWESRKGENLTLSLLLRPTFLETKDQFQLSMAIALGVALFLKEIVFQTISLKWPNDVLIDGKKVGGILIENQSQGSHLSSTIIGIGLNVNQVGFAFPNGASLKELTGTTYILNDLVGKLMRSLESTYVNLRNGNGREIRDRYVKSLYQLNTSRPFEANGETFVGTITDVDEFGRLCVQAGAETRKFSMKEIRML